MEELCRRLAALEARVAASELGTLRELSELDAPPGTPIDNMTVTTDLSSFVLSEDAYNSVRSSLIATLVLACCSSRHFAAWMAPASRETVWASRQH